MILLVVCLLTALLIFAIIQYSFLVPPVKGLPVLMYHRIDDTIPPDYLNVHSAQLEQQIQFLQKQKYHPVSFSELIDHIESGKPLPEKAVLLTIDDGYKNNFTQMYPILKRYNCKANIFLVSSFINTGSENDLNEYMTVKDLNSMDPQIIQFGLHTLDHKDYNKLSDQEIVEDLRLSKRLLSELGISFQPCFAYTYGSYPKKDLDRRTRLFEILKENNVTLAFRIGNRVNKLPIENKLLIKRIDIRGTDSYWGFRCKLKKGRIKLFG